MEKHNVKTKSGFSIEIEPDALDDMELLDELVEISRGNITKLRSVLTRLLGDNGCAALYEHLRNDKGRVPASAVSAELFEIMGLLNEGKK